MKMLPSLAILAVLVLATTWLAYRVNAQQPDTKPRTAPVAWEYQIVPLSHITRELDKKPDQILAESTWLQVMLNKHFGSEGWELCGVDSHMYFFRRPK
jgi:hypothetical protein